MRTYWACWFTIAILGGFLIPETWSLLRGRPQDTLSAAIWRLEGFQPGQPITGWNAFHFLFTGAFTLLTLWLIGHFGWGLWR